MLEGCRKGDYVEISTTIPKESQGGNFIRAGLLRFLLLGGDPQTPVHEKGVRLRGAWISDPLDLQGCGVTKPAWFIQCRFEEQVNLQDAHIKQFNLTGSRMPALIGDRLKCDGSLFLRNGFRTEVVRLVGAEIVGNLDCQASTFGGNGPVAIFADGLKLGGDFFIHNSFRAKGEVRFLGAEINGDLTCRNARLFGRPSSLYADRAQIGGCAFFNDCAFLGSVSIASMRVRGNVEFSAAKMLRKEDDALVAEQIIVDGAVVFANSFGSAGGINFLGAEIKGDFLFLDGLLKFEDTGFSASGATIGGRFLWARVQCRSKALDFRGMRVNQFADYPEDYGARTRLLLDGLCYDRITSAVEARSRIQWLKKQVEAGKKREFWPQPWEQLAAVLRQMGHGEEAKLILIEKQRELRRLGLIGTRKWRRDGNLLHWLIDLAQVGLSNLIARLSHRLYGALAGYGFRPMRTLAWMIAAWALATAVYAWGDERGLFAPRGGGLLTADFSIKCGDPPARWTRCPLLPSGYNTFDAPMFSLDALLPLVDLKQEADWAPLLRRGQGWQAWDGMLVRGTMWVEILFGWITSLLLVSAVGRLVQKD